MERAQGVRTLWTMLAALLVAGTLGSCASSTAPEPPTERTIALTYDDVTLGDGPYFNGAERTAMLVDGLEKAGVSEAMFFVTTGNVELQQPDGAGRVGLYTNAGHVLGNHSHSHSSLSNVDTSGYIADLDQATGLLAAFDNVLPIYRYPYLDEGRTLEKRDALRVALEARGLANGYVTVDTWDWYLDNLVKQAVENGDAIDRDLLRDFYVDIIVESAEFYDKLAQETLGRSPHHILLLHENDLAAMFVVDAVRALREQGFRIIPASVAFTDPVSRQEPDTLHLSQGRIAAIAHENGRSTESMNSLTQDGDYLTRRFRDEVLAASQP